MTTWRERRSIGFTTLLCALAASTSLAIPGRAQTASSLPATAPTGTTAPIAALATPADAPRSPHHRAQVTCSNGQLEVRADNSSLNGILRAISRCTGMQISGGVADQRVFGVYGPAAPATVIATLLDGTDTNMLLKETASDQPAQLILSPRTGGATPPSPNQVPDDDMDQPASTAGTPPNPFSRGAKPPVAPQPGANAYGATAQPSANANQTPVPQPVRGSIVSSPPTMPPTINNVMGSPGNTSPTASTYPTTNSVPLDSLPTPSTTPSPSGIVDAPNPPPAGSDTAKMMNGSTTRVPGNTTITPAPTGNATASSGANTSTSTDSSQSASQTNSNATSGALTPQQVYQQLMQMQQQKQQQKQQNQQQTPTTPATTPQ